MGWDMETDMFGLCRVTIEWESKKSELEINEKSMRNQSEKNDFNDSGLVKIAAKEDGREKN